NVSSSVFDETNSGETIAGRITPLATITSTRKRPASCATGRAADNRVHPVRFRHFRPGARIPEVNRRSNDMEKQAGILLDACPHRERQSVSCTSKKRSGRVE